MTFDEYQKQALTTVISSESEFRDLLHWVLGINGEAGEIAAQLVEKLRSEVRVL